MGWIGEPRKFQVWEYTVSHSQLLLRSPKEGGYRTRIDVLFKNVDFFRLGTTAVLDRIEEVEGAEVERLGGHVATTALTGDQRGYRLAGPSSDGLVIAGALVIHEDELESHEPSSLPLWPMRSGRQDVD